MFPVELDDWFEVLIDNDITLTYQVTTSYFAADLSVQLIFEKGETPPPEGPIEVPNPLEDEYLLLLGETIDHDFGEIIYDLRKTPYADVLVE